MTRTLAASLLICLIVGCSDDPKPGQPARDNPARQHEQNPQMTELQKSVADASKRLVEADAESRNKFLAMQENLRADQSAIGQQRDALEADRRELAGQRNRDSIVAAAIVQVGLYLACLLPLALAGYLLYTMRHTTSQDDASRRRVSDCRPRN